MPLRRACSARATRSSSPAEPQSGWRRPVPGCPAFITLVCDQADPVAIAQLGATVAADFPMLNILINNASIGLKRNLHDTAGALEDLEREIRINLSGPIQLVQQFLPQLKRRDPALIVNVTSGLAFVPLAVKPIYSATKAAMHSPTHVHSRRTCEDVVMDGFDAPAVAEGARGGIMETTFGVCDRV